MAISQTGPVFDKMRNTGRPLEPFIYIGFVKKNDDAQRMGRLSVWIPELGGDPLQESSWVIVRYASPFAGATSYTQIRPDSQTMEGSQKSYGWWAVPPDLDNEVAVFFANGDVARGFYFASLFQQNMNFMVPGVATNVTTEPSPPIKTGPVVEYNKANVQSTTSPRRPRFTPLSNGLDSEGLTSDFERGSASTSARREAPSKVFGYLTPRANTIHVDDNEQNEFIRMRTRSGTQVLISETTGYVYINSKNGNAWLEVSDAGVDVYSTNSVSIRAKQDLNVRADRNILLDAGANISLRAGKQITIDAGSDINASAGRNFALSVTANGSIHVQNDLKMKADANLRFESGADTSLKATGKQLRDGSTILDNAGQSPPASVSDAQVPTGTTTLDTTSVRVGSGPWNWRHGGGTVNSITSRMPTHEPWRDHPNSNVPPPPTEDVPINYAPSNGGGNASNVGPDGQLLNDSGCSFGAANTKPISTENYNAITAAADRTGVNPATMLAFSDLESSHQAGVGASTSSAKGLFQFTSGTWGSMVNKYGNQYNVSSDPNAIYDANSNALMGGQFIKDNTAVLQANGIANPTPGQLYTMHFLGSGGGPKMIQAAQTNPNADASSMFPAAAAANPSIFNGKTVGQVYSSISGRADAKALAYADQLGLPAPCTRSSGSAAGAPPGSSTPSSSDPNIPSSLQQYVGTHVGDSQCVALVQQVGGLPNTSQWKPGDAPSADTPIGTPIATFQNGRYANDPTQSHTGFYDGATPDGKGFYMVDQFAPNGASSGVVQRRTYTYGAGPGVQNASNYRVINL